MTPVADTLWRWIETNLMKNRTKWSNTLDYGVTVDEDDMDSMVDEQFGGYKKNYWFQIGDVDYKMRCLPLQNKNTREKHAYGSVKGGGENKVNILCYQDGVDGVKFNLHIQVRRLAQALDARRRAANKDAEAEGGWQTA
ncbi:MAG: hypothetical protein ACTHL8_07850 [Burkholderiaceae bacterium]